MSSAPLLQAVLAPQDRAELLRDIAALTHVYSVQVEDEAGSRSCRLDEAFAAMELHTGRRALIRYGHEGRIWMDTLLREGDEVRLVRVAEDDVLSGLSESNAAESNAAESNAAESNAAESNAAESGALGGSVPDTAAD